MTPKGWTRSTIGELCSIVRGTTPIMKVTPGPYPLVTTGEERRSADHFQVDGEAVCVPMISSTGHGHASLKRVHYQAGRFAVANIVSALLVRDHSRLLPRFLALYLHQYRNELIVPLMVGAANMSLTIGRLATVPVAFPSTAEQRNILDVVDTVVELTRLRDEADCRTADIVPALYHDLFSNPASNPENWPVAQFGQVLTKPLRNGRSPSSKGNVSCRVLTLSAITGRSFDGTAAKTAMFLSAPEADVKVTSGDFLICRGNGSVAMVGVGRFPICDMADTAFPDTMIAASPDPSKVDRLYLETIWNLPTTRHQIEAAALTTNGIYKVNQAAIEGISLPIPPLPLQQRFADQVREIRSLELRQSQSRQSLNALQHAILHQAFRGEECTARLVVDDDKTSHTQPPVTLFPVEDDSATQPVPRENPKPMRKPTPWKDDAAVLCVLAKELLDRHRPTYEFTVQKHVYMGKDRWKLPVHAEFTRKVAGPWSKQLRDKAIFTATKMNWLRWEGDQLVPGRSFQKGLDHAALVLGDMVAKVREVVADLEKFGKAGLERWATVLMAVRDLEQAGKQVTHAAVQHEIDRWQGKREKDAFTEESVDKTIDAMVRHGWFAMAE